MHELARMDHAFVWHPFTQMRDWLRTEPIVIVSGSGATLRDIHGRKYLDANASIWTNLHGHHHPRINAAIKRQLGRIAHSSALGLANEPATRLAKELVSCARMQGCRPGRHTMHGPDNPELSKVFFSDDGSTALEVALKLSHEFARRTRGIQKPRFLSLEGAYHGDTIGAVSLGHIDLFHKAYGGLLFKSEKVMSPYCYRCPFNKAKPERADARSHRQCRWECVGKIEQTISSAKRQKRPFSSFVVEPLMQGAAGMIPQPDGWLARVTDLVRGHGLQLVADEVMTGFGRMGFPRKPAPESPSLFASHLEGVQPDFLCLAKGLTGGYLPMAATLTTQTVFDAFLGEYEEFKTFFHGHSYTGNQLGAAAALASLSELQSAGSIASRKRLEQDMRDALAQLWVLPNVGDIRQNGLVAGVELVKDWTTRKQYALRERMGMRVCEAMARRSVLTRAIGNVIVVMPPYCTTGRQMRRIAEALQDAIAETCAG